MRRFRRLAPYMILTAATATAVCAALSRRPPVGNPHVPEPAKPVDLDLYAGVWFELARYENRFERDCEAVTAEYRPLDDGTVQVINTARRGDLDGPVRSIRGRARVTSGSGNAKLRVSFFGALAGDYWVLDHDDDYAWAIVGEPSGRCLWFLSRLAKPPATTLELLESRARELGYDTSRVRITRH